MKKYIFSLVALIIVAGGGWYWYSSMKENTSATPSTALGINGSSDQNNMGTPAVAPVVTIATDAKLGTYLVAANGMTLYMYTKDTAGVSNCSGACATNWPPYTISPSAEVTPGDGVTGTLSVFPRTDIPKAEAVQVTYNGAPLYFWKNDTKEGDTTGQNVGGVWFVVKP